MTNPVPRPAHDAGPPPRMPYARPALEPLGRWSARTLQVTGAAVALAPADAAARAHG